MVREPDATMQPTLQDNQLMSKHRVLSLKPQLRPEWRGQDGQSETEQPDHSASLCDFITSSTQIRFSVHTGHSCDEFTKPIALLGPHTAALGMRFYTGNMFPSEYRNAIFIARHGSWNRSKKIGGDIVVAKLSEDGTVKSIEPFITGFIENNNYVGRPADVVVLKDGSMLISDDFNGAVYRVSYGTARIA